MKQLFTRTSSLTKTFIGTGAMAMAFSAGMVMAQTTPSTVEPGQVQKRFEEPRTPTVAPEVTIPETRDQQVPAQADEVTFTLTGVNITGNTVYSEEELQSVYGEYLGQKVSLRDIYTIARRLTAMYRNDGYVLSRVVVEPQKIKGGVVQLRVIEGYIDDVIIEGDEHSRRSLVERYAAKIKNNRPMNAADLERYLLLIDDLPGMSAKGVLQPATDGVGASALTIQLMHDQVEGSVSADNRGSRLLGRYQGTGVVALNSLLGLHERTTLRGIITGEVEELQFFDITHEEQLGTEGTKLTGRAAYTSTEPGSFLEPLNIEGESTSFQIGVSHPFVRSRTENLTARLGFNYNNSESDISGLQLFEDHVRSVDLGFSYDMADEWAGVNLFDFSVSQGLDIFDALETSDSGSRSRADGESEFTKFNAEISRVQTLEKGFSVLARARGQYSTDPLFSSEEFGVGGSAYGRAYDASEITGDHGAAALVEVRYGGRYSDYKYIENYQIYAFYDIGTVWNKSNLAGTDEKSSLASTGAGVRFNFLNELFGYAEVSVPLTKRINSEPGDQGDEPRFFFRLVKRL